MITTKELVDSHVLWGQNEVVELLFSEEWYDNISDFEMIDNVLEWWLVTPYLADMLQEHGELVIFEHNCHWWGRTTSGQSVYMDYVMERIVEEINN